VKVYQKIAKLVRAGSTTEKHFQGHLQRFALSDKRFGKTDIIFQLYQQYDSCFLNACHV
jgi:hypothetical protein